MAPPIELHITAVRDSRKSSHPVGGELLDTDMMLSNGKVAKRVVRKDCKNAGNVENGEKCPNLGAHNACTIYDGNNGIVCGPNLPNIQAEWEQT